MKLITRIVLVFFVLLPPLMADVLEFKVNQKVVGLPYWPAQHKHYGAVLLVSGGEPQWFLLLTHFAEQLADNGWSVVMLNCNQDTSTPWVNVLPEAITSLRKNKNKRIVLVHYGDQLNQSLEYFSKPQAKMINGLVMLSAFDEQNKMEDLTRLRFPLFDVAGQFDYDVVLNQMELRGKVFQKHKYLALEIPGAHHDYEYNQELALAFIHGWMTKLPEIKLQPKPILVSYLEPVYSASSQRLVLEVGDWNGFIDNPVEP